MRNIFYILAFSLLHCFMSSSSGQTIHYVLNTTIEPAEAGIDVEAVISMPENEPASIVFELNSALEVYHNSDNIHLSKLKNQGDPSGMGMDRDGTGSSSKIKLNRYELNFIGPGREFSLKYRGRIEFPISQGIEDYQRGFSVSPGIISETGVYLAGSTYWIPTFRDHFFSYELSTSLPEGWSSVSQGERTMNELMDDRNHNKWSSPEPQEEVFLIAARFHEYSLTMSNGVSAMAFLRSKDDALANRYLGVTEQYTLMYEEMIGSYPYTKFALVENFWETGYGMPSFTLLGEKVIRFPFILHSSYPHELLHNWWGNSVYVDFETGNWCEGLTTYLADHLIKEQRDQAVEYRRTTLQKYSDFVSPENDFPVSEFLSRFNAVTETVGYGKSMMFFHMLRLRIGDDAFTRGLQDFYENNRFRKAGFEDIKNSMEKLSGQDLGAFFRVWIEKPGAPQIMLSNAEIIGVDRIRFQIRQVQDAPYDLQIPVYITTEKGVQKELITAGKAETNVSLVTRGKALKIELDPFYDIFRIVDPREVPPAFSKILASSENLIVLPSAAGKEKTEIYRDFADKWSQRNRDNMRIVFDDQIESLDTAATAWIMGKENRFAHLIANQIRAYGDGIPEKLKIADAGYEGISDTELIITVFEPDNYDKQMVFFEIGNRAAVDGLVRKLPHYGRYSYLGFQGDEADNMLKGQWEVPDSPLSYVFEGSGSVAPASEKRKALGELRPLFSKQRMSEHVEFLASEEMKGRGLGTTELDMAADYIAGKFRQYGLRPVNNSFFQEFSQEFEGKGRLQVKNVIGIIEGTDPQLSQNPVVLSAHYDHLGLGWPDVRTGNEGMVHYGADDNASGVAIMLEIANALANNYQPRRTVIFAAFTAEEAGLKGSRHFVGNLNTMFSGTPLANVNLDTNGRLHGKNPMVLNANSAREWRFIFMGTGHTTGISCDLIEQDLDASDQVAFLEKGIPAIQLFSGPHEDYHRPDDTPDKIDYEGMVKIAAVAKEVIEYLGNREDPMSFAGSQSSVMPSNGHKRSAATGAMPDFAHPGPGMKIAGIGKGSAGEKAGLVKDDVIISINGVLIENLRQYSDELKKFNPGDNITLRVLRAEKILEIEMKLGER